MVTVLLGLGGVRYLLLVVGQPVAFLVGLVLGFGAGWAWPGAFNYAVAVRFLDRVTTATSVTQTGVYVGAAGGPLLFGLIAEHFDVAAAWLTSGALTTLATVTLINRGAGQEPLMPPCGLFVGLTTLDLVQRVARRPGVNEKVVAQRSDLAAGGPAATAAVAFDALGGHSVLLSALGPGPVGRLAAGQLDRVGVQIVDAWVAGADLSISAIAVLAETGERSVVSRNAQDLTAVVPAGLPALVRDADVVLIDGHHPDLALTAARAAQTAGIPVVLDCGSAKPVYAGLVPLADAAVCSAGFTADGRVGFDAVSAALLADGARLVAMTAGAGPVRWRTRESTGTVEVPSVTVRDTLGAGDVLHGAVAFARARGVADPQRSLSFGVAVASLRVEHVGPRAWLDDQRLGVLVAQLG